MADPHRVLRRRRGPLQLALGGVLVALVLVVEVEAEQAASLVALGCQDGQGFHFSRPLTAAAMTELLGQDPGRRGFHLPVGKVAPVESLSG